MRIISGSARGRKLFSPEGMDVRPTTDKVKDSLFNILQFELEGAAVLDLFESGQSRVEADDLRRFRRGNVRGISAIEAGELQSGGHAADGHESRI